MGVACSALATRRQMSAPGATSPPGRVLVKARSPPRADLWPRYQASDFLSTSGSPCGSGFDSAEVGARPSAVIGSRDAIKEKPTGVPVAFCLIDQSVQ